MTSVSAPKLKDTLTRWFFVLLSSWLGGASVVLLIGTADFFLDQLNLIPELSWPALLLGTLAAGCLSLVLLRLGLDQRRLLLGSGLIFSLALIYRAPSLAFLFGLLVLLILLIHYLQPVISFIRPLHREGLVWLLGLNGVAWLIQFGYQLRILTTATTLERHSQPVTQQIGLSHLLPDLLKYVAACLILAALVFLFWREYRRGQGSGDWPVGQGMVEGRGIAGADALSFRRRSGLLLGVLLLAALQISIMSTIMVARFRGFFTPTYDFGIFSQMFHSMATQGTQVTTLERSYPLSHFAVHISPVFYLMLPFYKLFPRPETLQVLQILVVASGFIPLDRIAVKYQLKSSLRLFLAALYFLSPALSGSSFYDLHENCFLAPALLWLFWAIERWQPVLIGVFSVLVLAVKEDAAFYLLAIGLWLIFSKRVKAGIWLIAAALVVFLIELRLLSQLGDGLLAGSRFPNLSAWPERGILGAIPTFLLSPGYYLTQVFTARKWEYLLLMLLPLGFTPLLQRQRPARLILLLPFLVFNLVSSYRYLHDIHFQYHYGTGVILLYLCLLFWADRSASGAAAAPAANAPQQGFGAPASRAGDPAAPAAAVLPRPGRQAATPPRTASLLTAVVSLVCALAMAVSLWSGAFWAVDYSRQYAAELAQVRAALDQIPADASVRATTFMTAYLSQRETIYDLQYEDLPKAITTPSEYYVFDLRDKLTDPLLERISELEAAGWQQAYQLDNWILILKKEMPS